MAFISERWNENAAGMSGFGRMAVYDGSGTTGEGGDALADIRGNDFFDDEAVRDAIREVITVDAVSSTNPERGVGPHDNAGLLVWMKGNDGQAIDILYVHSSGEVRIRGTGIS